MDSITYAPLDSSPVTFSAEQVQRIADLAAALTPITEIAALIDADEDKLRMAITDKQSPLRQVYIRAKAETALAYRKRELELSQMGSPLAVQQVNIFLRDMAADEDL